MSMLFALRILTDLCYFVFMISSVASKFSHSGLLMTSPFIVAAAGYLCCEAWQRKPDKAFLRFLPILLCATAFMFTHTVVDKILTVPMVIYLFLVVFRKQMNIAYQSTVDRFYLLIKIAPAAIPFTVLVSNKRGFAEVMLPYFFFFLIVYVLLLRMLRHSENVNKDNRFRLMNALELGAVCGMGWLLSTGHILNIFKFVGNTTMMYVLRPILMVAFYIIGGVAWVFRKLTGAIVEWDMSQYDFTQLQIGENMAEPERTIMEGITDNHGNEVDTQILQYIGIALGIIVLMAVGIILFKILMRVGRKGVDNDLADVRESIDADPNEDKLSRSPRDRVRACYRKFLKLCVRSGLDPDLNVNSRDVNIAMKKNFDVPAMEGLREVYIRARYSSGEITEDDVKVAREMLDRTRKAEREEYKRRLKVDRSTGA